MRPYLDAAINVALDRSPKEWIGGIMIALCLALAVAGAHMACRRWLKVKDDPTPLVGLALVAIFAGMAIASVDVQLKMRGGAAASSDSRPPDRPFFRGSFGGYGSRSLTNAIFESADADSDGLLSPEEASIAAAKFIEEIDTGGAGAIDRETLVTIVRERMRPSFGPPGPPVGPPAPLVGPPAPPAEPAHATPPQS
jgi:hypothetical protein